MLLYTNQTCFRMKNRFMLKNTVIRELKGFHFRMTYREKEMMFFTIKQRHDTEIILSLMNKYSRKLSFYTLSGMFRV